LPSKKAAETMANHTLRQRLNCFMSTKLGNVHEKNPKAAKLSAKTKKNERIDSVMVLRRIES
jgi:phage terminase large subunit-like protein